MGDHKVLKLIEEIEKIMVDIDRFLPFKNNKNGM